MDKGFSVLTPHASWNYYDGSTERQNTHPKCDFDHTHSHLASKQNETIDEERNIDTEHWLRIPQQ